MKKSLLLVFPFLLVSAINGQETDWRQIQREDILGEVYRLDLKDGLVKAHENAKGFILYAKVKKNQIIGWEAKTTDNKKLKITTHSYRASGGEIKMTGTGIQERGPHSNKVEVVCVREKEVCFRTRFLPR